MFVQGSVAVSAIVILTAIILVYNKDTVVQSRPNWCTNRQTLLSLRGKFVQSHVQNIYGDI